DLLRSAAAATACASGAAGPLLAQHDQAAKAKDRPHLLLILDDQHRADAFSLDGKDPVHMPHLAKLAREGCYFRRAYTAVPSCLPSRAGLLTGMSPWNHGMLGYRNIAERYPVEMPRVLRDTGYRSIAVGKMHFHPQRNGHGFEQMILEEGWYSVIKNGASGCDYTRWFRENHPDKDMNATGLGYTDHRARPFPYDDSLHATHWTADQAARVIQEHEGGRPLFLKLSFQRPHPPFDPPRRWFEFYQDREIPQAHVGQWAEERFGKHKGRLEERPNNPRGKYPAEDIRGSRQGYYGAISFIDEQIPRVLKSLEQRGMLDDTLIIFLSDHADMMGDHHLWRKTYGYE
ncbi:MAG: sulfatase-like hydrolase/transferase, partial [Pirellulales bacterium]|nr:sulfatase-like hydrolase/transferase [Pirellulales bacterium]